MCTKTAEKSPNLQGLKVRLESSSEFPSGGLDTSVSGTLLEQDGIDWAASGWNCYYDGVNEHFEIRVK
jgi:hypothetical protein